MSKVGWGRRFLEKRGTSAFEPTVIFSHLAVLFASVTSGSGPLQDSCFRSFDASTISFAEYFLKRRRLQRVLTMLCNRCSGLVNEDLRLGGLGADCGVDVLTLRLRSVDRLLVGTWKSSGGG